MTGFDYELPPETVALQTDQDGSDVESVVSGATADSSVWTTNTTRKVSQSHSTEEDIETSTTASEVKRKKKLSTAVVRIGMHDIIR